MIIFDSCLRPADASATFVSATYLTAEGISEPLGSASELSELMHATLSLQEEAHLLAQLPIC